FVEQQGVAAAGLVQIGSSLRRRRQVHRLAEDALDVASFGTHGSASSEVSLLFSAPTEVADCQKTGSFWPRHSCGGSWPRISRYSQAWAKAQSRYAVRAGMAATSAACSVVRPAKQC